jgi:hypothetical protein
MRQHWTSGIDGLESGLLDRLFVQDPASVQLQVLCARALIERCVFDID